MSRRGVPPNEMNRPDGFPESADDGAVEALLRGAGRPLDPALADVLGDVRMAFGVSAPPATPAVAAFFVAGAAALPGRWTRHVTKLRHLTRLRLVALATAGTVAAGTALTATGVLVQHGPPRHAARAAVTATTEHRSTSTTTTTAPPAASTTPSTLAATRPATSTPTTARAEATVTSTPATTTTEPHEAQSTTTTEPNEDRSTTTTAPPSDSTTTTAPPHGHGHGHERS